MLSTLLPLHGMMEKNGPATLKEIAFVQSYGRWVAPPPLPLSCLLPLVTHAILLGGWLQPAGSQIVWLSDASVPFQARGGSA